MPRKRADIFRGGERAPASEPARGTTADLEQLPQKARHLRCPISGLWTRVESTAPPLEEPENLIDAGPYLPAARIERFGGRGRIAWDSEQLELTPEEYELVVRKLRAALELYTSDEVAARYQTGVQGAVLRRQTRRRR